MHLPSAFRKYYQLLKPDLERLITEIPKNDIIILRGKDDEYLCDEEIVNFLKISGFKIIEIADANHEIDGFKNILDKIIIFGSLPESFGD